MSEVITTVEYRSIQDHPGYRVGDNGSVWTCWQRVGIGWPDFGSRMVIGAEWKMMKPNTTKHGYNLIGFIGGKKKSVHRLVLEAFVGPCPDGMESLHRDGVRVNNALSNLKWGTKEENENDKVRHGTLPRGDGHHNSRATEEIVRVARNEYASGVPQGRIAKRFGLSRSTVGYIVRMESWTHIT